MEPGTCPSKVTSKRLIKYRQSEWSINEFEVWSGEKVCSVAMLRMTGSVLLWAGAEPPVLGELAAGVPGDGRSGLATTLVGEQGCATTLARRLATKLQQPVFVSCGTAFDRFALPLVESGLVTELMNLLNVK